MPSFAAPDGATLVYDAYEPEGTPRAAILLVPDWADHAGRYPAFGARLAREGFATYAGDVRGHGRSGGRRGHLTRFSQLLGDLQAFRRAARARADVPQILMGHGFGGLVVLRYLETQPPIAPAGAVLSSPYFGPPHKPAAWIRLATRLLRDLWPSLSIPLAVDPEHLSRDPATNRAFASDPAVQRAMTVGAWSEIRWAQRAIIADAARIETRTLFLLAGEDRLADAQAARSFAATIPAPVTVRWHAEMFHDLLHDPQQEGVIAEVLRFLADVQPAADADRRGGAGAGSTAPP